MRIGPYLLTPVTPTLPILTLAPMAGVGNRVFRLLCARQGARIAGVEFINCCHLDDDSPRLRRLLDFSDADFYRQTGATLLAAQLYGRDPEQIARGAGRLEQQGSQLIDINFGCSVPRLTGKGLGAAYLRDLDRLYAAVRLTVETVTVPVIVKTRIGWNSDSINILEVVRRVQDAGAQAIAIHARTVKQHYAGQADWSWIGRAREVAAIPVIGNGDVRRVEDAIAMQRRTSCDAVMIGRAAIANPWIFSGRNHAPLAERLELAIDQLTAMAAFKGELVGVRETRKHLAGYFATLPKTSPWRRRLLTSDSLPELLRMLHDWRGRIAAEGESAASPIEMDSQS